jgi:hypothetical protein
MNSGGDGRGRTGDDGGQASGQEAQDQRDADMAFLLEAVAGAHEDDGRQAVGAVFIGDQGGFAHGVPQQDFGQNQHGHQRQHDGGNTGHPVAEFFGNEYDSVHGNLSTTGFRVG